MKKLITLLLAATCILSLSVPAMAHGAEDRMIHYDDGSYLVISTMEMPETRAGNTTGGSTKATYYNSDHVLQWTVTLYGAFTYNGSSSTCTKASINVTISGSDGWSCTSKTADTSGSSAVGSATIIRTVSGEVVSTRTVPLRLTCDRNGNLS